jgi:WD40 repeat protein
MEATYKYWAFISYSSKDRRWGDWLIRAIETYRVPKRMVGRATPRGGVVPARAYPLFRDRDELPTDADLGSMIRGALEQSRYLIVICSPNSARSMWVNEEILTFKRLGRADRIFSLIIDGSPNASDTPGKDPDLECYPPALRYGLGPDGMLSKERTHPISADARRQGDGRANALLKLLAGVLGVNYDELRQREARRRRARVLTLTAGALCVAAAAAVFIGSEDAKQRAQQAEIKRIHQLTRARTDIVNASGELLGDQFDQALPCLSDGWALAPDLPALRIMINMALEGIHSDRFFGRVLPNSLSDAVYSPDGKSLLIWSNYEESAYLLPVDNVNKRLSLDSDPKNIGGSVTDASFDSSGARVFVAHGTLDEFDAASGRRLRTCKLPSPPVRLLALKKSQQLAVSLRNGTLVMVDLATFSAGPPLEPPVPKAKPLDLMALSPDGAYLAAGTESTGGLAVFDLAGRRRAWDVTCYLSDALPISFSPDAKSLLLLDKKGMANLFDAASGTMLSHLQIGMPGEELYACRFRPDGKAAVFGANAGKAYLYDFGSQASLPLQSDPGVVTSLQFSGDGRYLATGRSGTCLWDAQTGKLLARWAPSQGSMSSMRFSSDGSSIAAGYSNGLLRILDTNHRDPSDMVPVQLTGFQYPILFKHMAHAETSTIFTVEPGAGPVLCGPDGARVGLKQAPATGIGTVAFSPLGNYVGVAYMDGSIGVWETKDGNRSYWTKTSGALNFALSDTSASWLLWDGTYATADIARGAILGQFKDPAFSSQAIGFESGLEWRGSTLMVFDGVKTVDIQAAGAAQKAKTIALPETAKIAHLSPDGMLLSTVAGDGRIDLWDTGTGTLVRSVAPPPVSEGTVRFISWSPSGKFLLEANTADHVYIVDAGTGKVARNLGFFNGIRDASFFQNDQMVLCSVSGYAITVDVQASVIVSHWDANGDQLGTVAANSEGTHFVANGISTIHVWTLPLGVDAKDLAVAVSADSWVLDEHLDPKPR